MCEKGLHRWSWFSFFAGWAYYFWKTDLFWLEIKTLYCNNYCFCWFVLCFWETMYGKISVCWTKKQRKLISCFLIYYSYHYANLLLLVQAKWGAERARFEFVLSRHRLDKRLVNFFLSLFLYFFQKPKHVFKKKLCCQRC